MCGIAGALFDSIQAVPADEAVGRMVRTLGHRGPDGSGLMRLRSGDGAANVDVAVGHTRLAILDLSERGAQPMRDETERVTVTYNGEIYNFAQLRCELERRGRRFRSESDTEVILEGYREWGDDLVNHLRGMFAFALWDAERGRFLIARDRLGIKPLYYVERHGQFLVCIRGARASRERPGLARDRSRPPWISTWPTRRRPRRGRSSVTSGCSSPGVS